ncbi:MAG: aldo/keto reductase [Deltaproteobacteria bacterium]|jgi:aryl-alcohol dehydrogenase-like predicted oxidoreductase|nr:aldo/keto reductase [Deltaproteobacteria bacterium]MBW2481073.1 aldo/keto reductase [Deltaproteobacteria bacterium]
MKPNRRLGKGGPSVGTIGYGAMGLEGYYGATDEDNAVAVIRHALDEGCSLIDTADAYGNGHNEQLVGRAVADRRNEAFVATKFGIVFDPDEAGTEVPTGWGFSLNINGTPEYAQRCLDSSLKRLGMSHIDLWYIHYPDPATSIEETVEAMAAAVRAGKVRYLGLSNVTADQVRRAHAVHPIAAVQFEYSLWRREVETEMLPILRELAIALVPWSPLGGGFLTGTIGALEEDDFRNNNPRFQGDNFTANKQRFAPLMTLAEELGITAAQLSLAWLLHQGEDIIPIPGTRSRERVTENAKSAEIGLDAEALEEISELAAPGMAQGQTLLP